MTAKVKKKKGNTSDMCSGDVYTHTHTHMVMCTHIHTHTIHYSSGAWSGDVYTHTYTHIHLHTIHYKAAPDLTSGTCCAENVFS